MLDGVVHGQESLAQEAGWRAGRAKAPQAASPPGKQGSALSSVRMLTRRLAKRVEATYQMDGSLQARLTLAKAPSQQAGLGSYYDQNRFKLIGNSIKRTRLRGIFSGSSHLRCL